MLYCALCFYFVFSPPHPTPHYTPLFSLNNNCIFVYYIRFIETIKHTNAEFDVVFNVIDLISFKILLD